MKFMCKFAKCLQSYILIGREQDHDKTTDQARLRPLEARGLTSKESQVRQSGSHGCELSNAARKISFRKFA